MTDKPLHVQVAEALGWRFEPPHPTKFVGNFWRKPNGKRSDTVGGRSMGPPRYDLDWSDTGPLIEQYGIDVLSELDGWTAMQTGKDENFVEQGNTPLLAVCHLILKLSAAGKLDQQKGPSDAG